VHAIARVRPWLVLAGLTLLLSGLIPFNVEDGGIVRAIDLTRMVLLWPVHVVLTVAGRFGVQPAGPVFVAALLCLLALYVWLDRRVTGWARRSSQGAA
jgi:hypothetical protein